MTRLLFVAAIAAALVLTAASGTRADTAAGHPVPVTPDNFIRAESDMYFASIVKQQGLGVLHHSREPMPIDHQTVIRANRDTLYSSAVFDLDAGPVTITMPDSGGRFMSLVAINQDDYIPSVHYGAGAHTFSKENVGTRYVLCGIRTFVDPADAADLEKAHMLQDAVAVNQPGGPGQFNVPNWDPVSQKKVRNALLVLAETMPDLVNAFGRKGDVDPVRHLIATASAWGGNPDKDATYLNVTPARNDGKSIYRLSVKDVPVDGFWSISVYNQKGYYTPNGLNAYSLNNITAKKSADGSISIQFGGCDGQIPNCLPITPGWNYMVRLYRPRSEILKGSWKFPEAQPVN
jgi:hypothetical protein